MEIFITAPQGGGKTLLAQRIATEYLLLLQSTKEKPMRVTSTFDYGKNLEKDVEGSDIIIFDEIASQSDLTKARAIHKKAGRKPLCIYVTHDRLTVKLHD